MVLVDRLTVYHNIIYCLSAKYVVFLVNLVRYGIKKGNLISETPSLCICAL